ncbi:phosphoribosylanthranilate transferase [Panicum miliaceum]|uniref:Phosphoribosylanthranilate transferase n=1 Tax=Panicum miliaceum TaxID=4540 RepID=A0A3L6QJB5_PANMI|nr:phosphoribosylanthranilate transferase [Panicum miliaceum]
MAGVLPRFGPFGPLPPPQDEFGIKETRPRLAGGRAGGYDLVERMEYLYVRAVKARDLRWGGGDLDPFAEVKLGGHSCATRHIEKTASPEWNDVFAFSRERIQASFLDVVVRGRGFAKDDYVGHRRFDLGDAPVRVPPDSALAPQWYHVFDGKGERGGEVMLAVWFGTQADECFPLAMHADAAIAVDAKLAAHIRCKQYTVPRLWYVRVNVIEARDVAFADKARVGEVFVRTRIAGQVHRTKTCVSRLPSYGWNEDHLFVAAEPFEDHLILSVEDRVKVDKEEVIGHVHIPFKEFERRWDARPIRPIWFNLVRPEGAAKIEKFSAKICVRLCLEGGYRVLSEPVHYLSDVRPAARELWHNRPPIGLIELGIHNAFGLSAMRTRDGRGSCDAYCVAKYGVKWFRTQTVIDSLAPRFHQQCYWDVHDHCTVLTVAVFHNCQIGDKGGLVTGDPVRDVLLGKVRIRLSTLETGRIYTHAYPLISLHGGGIKKMGELQLAMRFSNTSTLGLLRTYAQPHLPPMHYHHPLSIVHQETLRREAVALIAHRLGRMDPPLRRECVEHLCEAHSHRWSMRRSKAHFFRLMAALAPLFAALRWFVDVCHWKNPATTVAVHIIYAMLVCCPNLILPTFFVYKFLLGLWNYRCRPRHPWHVDTKVSHAELAHPDELDEEFDEFPTARPHEVVRMRYDRLRSLGARIQEMVGDVAAHAERARCAMAWRDPRATAMYLLACLFLAVTTFLAPFQAVALLTGFYVMRHPALRQRLPDVPTNFFRRLPCKVDCLL